MPNPGFTQSTNYQAPQGKIEQQLVNIWQAVFNIPVIGRMDDYFHLGGDSITAMQVAAQARQVGLIVKVSDILTHTTVANLSLVVKLEDGPPSIPQGTVCGAVALTPIQKYFFEAHLHCPHEFSQYTLLQVKQSLQVEALQQACKHYCTIMICCVPLSIIPRKAGSKISKRAAPRLTLTRYQ